MTSRQSAEENRRLEQEIHAIYEAEVYFEKLAKEEKKEMVRRHFTGTKEQRRKDIQTLIMSLEYAIIKELAQTKTLKQQLSGMKRRLSVAIRSHMHVGIWERFMSLRM